MRAVFQRWVRGGIVLCIGLVHAGCGDSQERAIKALHEEGIKFTVEDFHATAGRGDLVATRMFIEAGMALDVPGEGGMTALIRASENGALPVVQWLLENGADVHQAGPNGRTALLAAAREGHADLVRLLLKNGANPLCRDADNWSPLTLAAYKGEVETVDILAPKSTELLDDALLVAAFGGNTEVIDLLLTNGAYVNGRGPNDQTALMIAAANGHLDAVKLFMLNGANRYALDGQESTAADLAAASGFSEISAYLNQPPDPYLPRDGMIGANGGELSDDKAAPWETAAAEPVFPATGLTEPGFESRKDPDGIAIGGPANLAAWRVADRGRDPGQPERIQGVEIRDEDLSREEVPAKFRMKDYREENLPVVLKGVTEEAAEVRVLYGGGAPVTVREGEPIAGTGLQVVKFERQFANSKHGKGRLVDVSRMVVQDRRTGAKHLLVKDVPAKSSETYALMVIDDTGRAFDVRPKDEFTASGTGYEDRFRIVDVRPTQVVIENTVTAELFTISRGAAPGISNTP